MGFSLLQVLHLLGKVVAHEPVGLADVRLPDEGETQHLGHIPAERGEGGGNYFRKLSI